MITLKTRFSLKNEHCFLHLAHYVRFDFGLQEMLLNTGFHLIDGVGFELYRTSDDNDCIRHRQASTCFGNVLKAQGIYGLVALLKVIDIIPILKSRGH